MGVSSHSGPINLGNPKENTLLELAQIVTDLVGGAGDINYLPLPEDDPKRRNPDITRAVETLKWTPRVSLETGIVRTAAWMKKAVN
jgi:nucleoside-diphosphate-sugar epimerase